LVKVSEVKRTNGVATRVTVGTENVGIMYILENGQPKEIGRLSPNQVLDDQSLVISAGDLQKTKKIAAAILREKR
jgi:hypothetical protein